MQMLTEYSSAFLVRNIKFGGILQLKVINGALSSGSEIVPDNSSNQCGLIAERRCKQPFPLDAICVTSGIPVSLVTQLITEIVPKIIS
jgi:hypothetical protein